MVVMAIDGSPSRRLAECLSCCTYVERVSLTMNEGRGVYVMVMQTPVLSLPINNQVLFDVAPASEVAPLFASVAACKSACCVISLTARGST